MPKQGEFVWHDLSTPDLDGATAFYGEVMGWKGEQMPGVDLPFICFYAGSAMIGGAMLLADEMKQAGAPPSWTPCMATEDLDALCTRAASMGATIMQPPTDAPGGRFAMLQDPQGAVFEAYQAADKNGESEQQDKVSDGHFSWYDLNTTDWEGARAFYGELFGWTESGVMEDSPSGTYWMFKGLAGDRTLGGMSNGAKMMNAPAHWLCYVTVPDLDASVARLQQLGGQVMNGPMAVPGGDRIVHCMDAQGAAIALHARA